jgi:hypothetical protein
MLVVGHASAAALGAGDLRVQSAIFKAARTLSIAGALSDPGLVSRAGRRVPL